MIRSLGSVLVLRAGRLELRARTDNLYPCSGEGQLTLCSVLTVPLCASEAALHNLSKFVDVANILQG